MNAPSPPAPADGLLDTLQALRAALEHVEIEEAACLEAIHPDYRASARNLLHVIAFHRLAHPGLAQALRQRGLCPLTDGDPHLLASLEAVSTALEALEGPGPTATTPGLGGAPDLAAPDLLGRRCERLFGTEAAVGGAGLMVTLPAEAAERPVLIADLLAAGMTIARIDCAHDNPAVWGRMVEALTRARVATGRPCAIAMDLAGPRLRIGSLAPQPAVIRARPRRDRMGRPIQPVRILAVPPGARVAPQDPEVVQVPARLSKAKRFKAGVRLRGRDASGRRRTLTVVRRGPDGVLLQANRTCRFVAGLVFRQRRGRARLVVGPLAPVGGERRLRPGDAIRLTPEPDRGAGTLPCSLPEVFPDLRPGERVLIDGGRIGAAIQAVSPREVVLEVTAARARGSRLRSDGRIHFPDSDLRTPALTARDIDDLAFVTQHADMICCSFVHRESDIGILRQCLEERGGGDAAVVLTIATRQAFLNLPRLLLAAMAHGAPVGVMVARGDLAIACGWDALAPIQEEILRICAAAHVPCITTTVKVLEASRENGATRPSAGDLQAGNLQPGARRGRRRPPLTGLEFRSNGVADDPVP